MATHDVPGAVGVHNDELGMGCWAEHEDGSLIFVQSTEGGRVVYQMFDLSVDPITEYRDAMPEKGFKEFFSWNPKKKDSIKWKWHDKTPFPWERVIKAGARDGHHFASAHDQLSAAAKVANSIDKKRGKGKKGKKGKKMKKQKVNPVAYEHLMEEEVKGPLRNRIIDKVQGAINKLRA